MTRCWICDRAMVHESYLPLNICRRASCDPEREFLTRRWAHEHSKSYYRLERATR